MKDEAFPASIWQEDDRFIAQCLDVDVHLHFTPPLATKTPDIATVEVERNAA